MASRDSWIDPDEVSGLAGEIFPEGKRASPEEADAYVPVPLLDDEELASVDISEEVAADCDDGRGTADRIAERLKSIRQQAERSGLLVGSESKPKVAIKKSSGADVEVLPEPFVLNGGRLVEQVIELVDWMAEGFDQGFVLDELGDELVAGEVSPGLRSGAVRLAQSWERSQRWLREEGQAAAAPVAGAAIGEGGYLSVVGVRCSSGFYCAALVGDQMISVGHAERISDALFLVFG